MTREEFRSRWHASRDALAEVGALVDGAKLLDRVLSDVDAMFALEESATLSLAAASAESGYSRDHLARMIRRGAVPNAGRHHAPRIRRIDLPRKAGRLQSVPRSPVSRAQVARAVVDSLRDQHDD